MSIDAATLYVVATPIGNLGDISQRALQVLEQADWIAAEDTRHSARLLQHFVIRTPCFSLHEHNERQKTDWVLEVLGEGKSIALISDAGTPLISDPGYHLVKRVRGAGFRVVPIPGASALTAALSVAGVATDRFMFLGFPPHKGSARRRFLEAFQDFSATLVFYESPHRILDSLRDMQGIFGAGRAMVLCRELTKTFETVLSGSIDELICCLEGDANQQKGEFVVLLEGAVVEEERQGLSVESQRIAAILAAELPLKQAAALTASIASDKKNAVYQWLLSQKQDN